jgi:hypothetical protein
MDRKEKKYRSTQCLNCETHLDISEKYCHACGQLNSTKKLTITDFIEEFFSNFYAYDSRLRNSIVSIFTKPGVLAREFNQGKRHTYANPFRLFLSVSIILFITLNLTKGDYEPSNKANEELTKEQVKEERKQDSIAIEKLATGETKKTLFKKLRNNEIKYSLDSIYTKKQLNTISLGYEYTLASFRNFHKKYPEKTTEQALKELGFENKLAFRILYKKSKALKSNDINSEIIDYFYEKLPFFIFLCLPILTLMFWIVYYSNKINYTEHLVFSYTFFTFIFLCMILFNFIDLISTDVSGFFIGISFAFLFPIYFYKSLRNFYQQGRWITILKFILLNPLFFLFLGICAIIMMFLGILLF